MANNIWTYGKLDIDVRFTQLLKDRGVYVEKDWVRLFLHIQSKAQAPQMMSFGNIDLFKIATRSPVW